jgi:hypothetical protein
VPGVLIFATIRILCEADTSLGSAIVNGLLAWAAILGGSTVLFTGLPAALAMFIPDRADTPLEAAQPLAGNRLHPGYGRRPLDVLCLHR